METPSPLDPLVDDSLRKVLLGAPKVEKVHLLLYLSLFINFIFLISLREKYII